MNVRRELPISEHIRRYAAAALLATAVLGISACSAEGDVDTEGDGVKIEGDVDTTTTTAAP